MNTTSQAANFRDELPIACFKNSPEDFRVDEILGFELDGEGEHLWIKVKKTGQNTRDVAESLARVFGVAARDVGHSGLKDKNAVTTQWFSLPLAIAASVPDEIAAIESVEIIQLARSRKKLRVGSHQQNRFHITLRDLSADHAVIDAGLQRMREQGFPNWFGSQRFGHGGRNVAAARSMFQSKRKITRFKRGIYLSAARSYLFNQVLAARVEDQSWQTVLPGEACILNGTNSLFKCPEPDDAIHERHRLMDIHTSGPMHGRGASACTQQVLDLETRYLQAEPVLIDGLEAAGLKQERRALRSIAHELDWKWSEPDVLTIGVTLQRGVYATALLGEIVKLQEGDEPASGEQV